MQGEPDREKEGLYSIGALSKMVSLSKDTLRYYDEIGLFKPVYVSEQTGYRYYATGQAVTLARIMELKQYGFSLTRIKELLEDSHASLDDVYQNRYQELLGEKRQLQEAIDKLSVKIRQQQEGFYMNKSILLVDDAKFMRMMCKDILSREGFVIAGEAENGAEAVELYKKLSPDLVLMDITMPVMDGIYATQQIKTFNTGAKVVMCSAMGQCEMVTESLMAGAYDFIVKPFTPEKLIAAVRGAFGESRLFNRPLLQRIHDQSARKDHKHILSQNEIDRIIQLALAGNVSEAEALSITQAINDMRPFTFTSEAHEMAPSLPTAFVNAVKEMPLSTPHQPDAAVENNTPLLATLDRLVQGQEEIKTLLQHLVNEKK